MRRALEPQQDHWAIPAGLMEEGEILQQAAARELREETGLTSPPSKLQLYMMGTISFIGEVETEASIAGIESLNVGFFSRDELPWSKAAHPEVGKLAILSCGND